MMIIIATHDELTVIRAICTYDDKVIKGIYIYEVQSFYWMSFIQKIVFQSLNMTTFSFICCVSINVLSLHTQNQLWNLILSTL